MTYAQGPYGYGYPPPPPPPKPGVIPLAPLGFSEILTGAFSTYGRYWKPLVGVALAAYTGLGLVVGGALLAAWAAVGDQVTRLFDTPAGETPDVSDVTPMIVAFVCVWLAAMVALVLANALVSAAAPAVLQEAVLGRPIGFAETWQRAWSRLGAVLGSLVLTALATMLPMLLALAGFAFLMAGIVSAVAASDHAGMDDGQGLAVTGALFFLVTMAMVPLALWLQIKFSLAPTVAVIEQQSAMGSLRRSSALVKGSWWRTFGCLIAAGAIAGMVNFAIQQVVQAAAGLPMLTFQPGDEVTPGEVFSALGGVMAVLAIASVVTQAFIAPFQPLVMGLVYVDRRIRGENLAPALAQQAAQQTAEHTG
ncbi:oxidoreductase [Streptomyces sp. NPDC048623]|uniref:oxidoreductase n=1 Tax=Streptomyces sp. NPDC048623 TaxID=3155761 RepID=UPI00341E36B8